MKLWSPAQAIKGLGISRELSRARKRTCECGQIYFARNPDDVGDGCRRCVDLAELLRRSKAQVLTAGDYGAPQRYLRDVPEESMHWVGPDGRMRSGWPGDRLRAYLDSASISPEENTSLVTILGENGTGKSTMACELAYRYLKGRKGRVLWIDCPWLFNVDTSTRRKILSEAGDENAVVIWDDYGANDGESVRWTAEVIFPGIHYRHARLMPQIITSHKKFSEIKNYHTPSYDRMKEGYLVQLTSPKGESYRGK